MDVINISEMKLIKSFFSKLDTTQLEELSSFIFEEIINRQYYDESSCRDIFCTACHSTHYVKNGKVRGKQRFLCKDCLTTFGLDSNSVISKSKLTVEQWHEYIKCMINGLSIRKSAENINVCVKTAFYMRHKILDAINAFMQKNCVSGLVEMDETFIAESFKGNHKKSGFQMPRASRKRGKEISKRGISKEQICIGTAIDKNNNIIMETVCKGRITSKKLEKLYTGYISEGSTICTDSYSGYKTLARTLRLNRKQIPAGRHSDGLFGLSNINSLHSKFKRWIRKFNGVSTKHLANYLVWFKWLEKTKQLKETVKPKQMWKDAMAKQVDVRICKIREKEVKFI